MDKVTYLRPRVFAQFRVIRTIWISIALVISRISWNFKTCNIESVLLKTPNHSHSNTNPKNNNNNNNCHLQKWNRICNHRFLLDWWPNNSHSSNSYYSLLLAIKYLEIITNSTILMQEKYLFQLSNSSNNNKYYLHKKKNPKIRN